MVNNESVPLNGKCYNHEGLTHWEDGNSGGWTCPVYLSNSTNHHSEWHEYNVDECFNYYKKLGLH